MNTLVIHIASLYLLCWFAAPIASAAECENFRPHATHSEAPRYCQCGSDLKKLHIHIPLGLKLNAVCDLYFEEATPINLKDSNDVYSKSLGGYFYFKGDLVITGSIKKGDEVNRGSIYFYPNPKNAKSSYREIGFEDEKVADSRFGSTTYIAGWPEKHWCAPATIRIKQMYLYEWSSEASGAYALDYEVLEVGKYSRCEHS